MNTLDSMGRLKHYFQAKIVREEISEEICKEMKISEQREDDRNATVELFTLNRELRTSLEVPRTGKDKWQLSGSDGHAYGQRSQISSIVSQRRLGNICSQMTKFITAVKMYIMTKNRGD